MDTEENKTSKIHDAKVDGFDKKILLIGNPNVGKSVIFSALTGIHVMSSNFAGTTVTYTKGTLLLEGEEHQLIDVPGTYALSATSEAEEVAVNFLQSGALAVVCVLDATNLTRNLNLALELLQYNLPVVFCLNLMDIAKRKGIEVDIVQLEKELGVPVIETVAVKGEGFEELKKSLATLVSQVAHSPQKEKQKSPTLSQEELWKRSAEISNKVQHTTEKTPNFLDKLGSDLVKPYPGIPIAILIMVISLALIVGGGKGLRIVAFIPLVNGMIIPFFQNLIGGMGLPTLLNDILIGEYGILVIGFEWPIALILPYVTLFYIVFTFWEDCGVLPRMAVLFDGLMSKMGVQGGSLIALVMGYGCAVPAIIGTRTATTRKERIIITAMVCFAVPCISQSAALFALLSSHSLAMVVAVFALSFLVVFLVGLVTGKMLKGTIDPIMLEIPNLLLPEKKAYGKKLLVRLKGFLLEAEGPMMIAVVFAAVLKESGMLDGFASLLEPIISGFLGLPKEAVIVLLLGVIRREMAVAPLLDMDLNTLQLFVGATVTLLYLPCLSVFGVLAKEFDAKVAIGIGVSTFSTAILLGGLINFVGGLFF